MSLPRYFCLLVLVFATVYSASSFWSSARHRSSLTLRNALVQDRNLASQIDQAEIFGESAKSSEFAAVAEAKIQNKPSIQGSDPNWFFLVRELRQIAAGKFWEKDWETVAANKTDPLPSMLEFKDLLAKKGIKLLVLPIPAKAAMYPEKLSEEFQPGDAQSLSPLLHRFREAGLNVVDLEKMFLRRRQAAPDDQLFCGQDAHFSPLACELIAEYVFEELGGWDRSENEDNNSDPLFLSPVEKLSITGDQVAGTEWEGKIAAEKLSLRYAGRKMGGKIHAVMPDPTSPVLLVGDSHTLVFHEGESGGMHCRGAGLFDHLSYQFGFPIDLVGVRGSGLIQARKSLLYHAAAHEDYWQSKKIVIWVFSSREFTQSYDKVFPIPIERSAPK